MKKEELNVKSFDDLTPFEARDWFDFLRNLRLFRGWSLESIHHLLHYTKLCKYNQKEIITSNTKTSSDILIVKTGQVLVWTQLRRNTNSVLGNNSNLKDASKVSFSINGKSTPANSQESERSSGTEYRSLNLFNDKFKNESFNLKSRFISNSENMKRIQKEKTLYLPDLSNKSPRKLEKPTKPILNIKNNLNSQNNKWDNFFQNQASFYLQLLKLKRGDVFGVESNLAKDYPNCQLISDDCECFIIDKNAFLNYSPYGFSEVFQYQYNEGIPTNHEIDVKFKEYVKWKHYRKKVFQETTIQRIRNKISSFR